MWYMWYDIASHRFCCVTYSVLDMRKNDSPMACVLTQKISVMFYKWYFSFALFCALEVLLVMYWNVIHVLFHICIKYAQNYTLFKETIHRFVRHHFVKRVHNLRNRWEYQGLRNQLCVLIGHITKIYIPFSPSYFCRFHRNDTLRRQMVPPCHMKAGPRPNWEPWIRTTACHIMDFAMYFIYL